VTWNTHASASRAARWLEGEPLTPAAMVTAIVTNCLALAQRLDPILDPNS
jgi:hypothetical protein